jgi:hypothetical protein
MEALRIMQPESTIIVILLTESAQIGGSSDDDERNLVGTHRRAHSIGLGDSCTWRSDVSFTPFPQRPAKVQLPEPAPRRRSMSAAARRVYR